ncbi:MAG: hypothetical protein H6R04_1029 [Burkholderiaceae bacterium]|nr:hypothetical protein [Burkholderiaceae bacterium]
MKRLIALLMLAATAVAPASATPPKRPPPQLVDVKVVDRTSGHVLETWYHDGKMYVAGAPGNRYAVHIRNRSGGRVLAVLAVDGVNAVSGETAATSQRGYLLQPWRQTEVAGWRKSQNEVAAFYFTRLSDSYAARTDRPDNVGVIGVAVFREYVPPPPPPPPPADISAQDAPRGVAKKAAKRAAPAPAGSPAPTAESLGTGHGERIDAPSRTVDFRRDSNLPAQVVRIYYDSRANLIARGIIPSQTHRPREPQAFPGGYVPDPR